MPVTGKPLQPRELAQYCWETGWRDKDLITAVAVCLSESGGYPTAWHDNKKKIAETTANQVVANVETYEHFTVLDPKIGKVKLSDGSIVNYPISTLVITSRDIGLFQINMPASIIGTDAEKALYVIDANLKTAFSYWKNRGWQPWYGYTNGYATSTEWWHFSATKKTWVPTGRYLHRATRGVANYYAKASGLNPVPFLDYYSIPPKPTTSL